MKMPRALPRRAHCLALAGLFTLAASAVAFDAAKRALVFALSNLDPQRALSLSPGDATSIARHFERQIATGRLGLPATEWRRAAREGLTRDPLNAEALRVLGYVGGSGAYGDRGARRLMALSERLSRRDLLTQIWLIEASVVANDVPAALAHYDRALSVYPQMASTLFPILTNALTTPDILNGLVPYMRANRPWAEQFLTHLVASAPDLRIVARLFARYGGVTTVPAHRKLESQLLYRLVERGYPDYAQLGVQRLGGHKEALLRDIGFSNKTSDPAFRPLSWVIGEGDTADATLAPSGDLVVRATPGTQGIVASRTMLLPKGSWTLIQTIEYGADGPAAEITWVARCVKPGMTEALWQERLPVGEGAHPVRSTFIVKPECRGVAFEVLAQGPDTGTDARTILRDVTLTRG